MKKYLNVTIIKLFNNYINFEKLEYYYNQLKTKNITLQVFNQEYKKILFQGRKCNIIKNEK